MTTDDVLAALLVVQDLDLAIDQHRHRRDHLPERAELAVIDAQASALRADRTAAVSARDEVARRQAEAETELASTEARAAAVSRRLYGGEVSASRELQAMAGDVEHLTTRASTLEDEVLELLEERDPLDHRIEQLDAQLTELSGRRQDVLARVATAQASIDDETAGLVRQRDEAATALPAALMTTYQALRARLGGVGVARLVGNHCDGCHLTLSAVELDHIRRLAPGETVTCEQCSRILVP